MVAPFTVQREAGNKVNWIRILEFLIGSIIIAGITSFVNEAVMGEKVESIRCSVAEIKASVEKQDDRIREMEIRFAAHDAKASH